MEDRLNHVIEKIGSWDELKQLEANVIASKGELSGKSQLRSIPALRSSG